LFIYNTAIITFVKGYYMVYPLKSCIIYLFDASLSRMEEELIKKHLVLYLFLVLILSSCSMLDQEEDGSSSGSQAAPFVPEGGVPPAPMLLDEEIDCDYFVSPGGDDSAVGSEAQPWASFQYVVDSAEAGDTVCFRDGIYRLDDAVYISESGTVEDPITFIAYPGERPVLDGRGEVTEMISFKHQASYLRFSGFTLQNFTIWGIWLAGENRYVHLDHLEIVGGEAAVRFTYGESSESPPAEGPVEYITLEDSLIHGSQYSAVDCTPGPCNHIIVRRVEVYGTGMISEAFYGSDGIEFARGYPVLVEDCYVHDNGGDGIDLNSRDRDGYATGVVVRRNRVVRNALNGIKLWAGGLIENNVVLGQGNSALWLGTFHSALEVKNNTIAYNMWDPAYSERNWVFVVGYPDEIPEPQVELLLGNNIFAFNTGPSVGDPTGLYLGPGVKITEHHNLYFSREDEEITAEFLGREVSRQEIIDGTWTSHTGQGQGDLGEDPLFVSGWPDVDLHLGIGSPAIDAGDNTSCPAEDVLGNSRPVDGDDDGDAICDIGAFEWED
jgi:hypothetical protein